MHITLFFGRVTLFLRVHIRCGIEVCHRITSDFLRVSKLSLACGSINISGKRISSKGSSNRIGRHEVSEFIASLPRPAGRASLPGFLRLKEGALIFQSAWAAPSVEAGGLHEVSVKLDAIGTIRSAEFLTWRGSLRSRRVIGPWRVREIVKHLLAGERVSVGVDVVAVSWKIMCDLMWWKR